MFHNCKHHGIPKWAKNLVTKILYRPEDDYPLVETCSLVYSA